MFAASINKQKNKEPASSFISGASGENRTLVPSLENLYTNRCTTLANPTIYSIPIAFTCQKAKTKDCLKHEQTLV